MKRATEIEQTANHIAVVIEKRDWPVVILSQPTDVVLVVARIGPVYTDTVRRVAKLVLEVDDAAVFFDALANTSALVLSESVTDRLVCGQIASRSLRGAAPPRTRPPDADRHIRCVFAGPHRSDGPRRHRHIVGAIGVAGAFLFAFLEPPDTDPR